MGQASKSRSHYGCINCKNRKVKCGEEKPICANCIRLRLACRYSSSWSRRRAAENDRSEHEESIHPDDLLTETASRSTTYEFLMYHYCTQTAKTFLLPSPFAEEFFTVEYPAKGLKYRFLLDTIYLLTASHLHHLHPCSEYNQYVVHFSTLAVRGLRPELGYVADAHDPERTEAVAMASSLLSIFSLTCDLDTPFSGLSSSLMPLFKGMRSVFSKLWPYRHQTGFNFLDRHIETYEKTNLLGDEYVPDIERVFELQKTNVDIYKPVIKRLASLTYVFLNHDQRSNRSFHLSNWIISLPPEFLKLTDDLDPCALVLLARYFYMVSTDQSWFMGSYAYKHYLRVSDKIPPHWRPCIQLQKS
jgi:hypothetical protein